MFESHRPFVQAVLNRTNTYSQHEIEDWLSGGHDNPKLAKAFEAWSHGDSVGITFALLGREEIAEPPSQK